MPDTLYTRSGETHIAYQVFGDGPIDFVNVPGWASNVDAHWENPVFARHFRKLASLFRVLQFDKRGVGLSDPIPVNQIPSLELWMDDLLVLMDVAGSQRAVIAGYGHGGPLAMLFAATYPDRCASLFLTNTFARLSEAPDFPIGLSPKTQEAILAGIGRTWGTGKAIERLVPSRSADVELRRFLAKFERACASPGVAELMQRSVFGTDVRHVLPTISVPTFVLHTRGDRFVDVAHGRYLADHIAGARFVELNGEDDFWWLSASDGLYSDLEEFATGHRGRAASDRVLATILFSDIVASTERASVLGDARWRELLDAHDATAKRCVDAFRGRLVKSTGDGVLATFDGPGRAIGAAKAMREGMLRADMDLRLGLHTGEVEVRGGDVGGIAVHIAARVMGCAGSGEILVSGAVPPLVAGSNIEFAERGTHELKGVPGTWQLFEVR